MTADSQICGFRPGRPRELPAGRTARAVLNPRGYATRLVVVVFAARESENDFLIFPVFATAIKYCIVVVVVVVTFIIIIMSARAERTTGSSRTTRQTREEKIRIKTDRRRYAITFYFFFNTSRPSAATTIIEIRERRRAVYTG